MSKSPIQLDNEVKARLEDLRDNKLRVKTHSDAVDRLMTDIDSLARELYDLGLKRKEEAERRKREYIYLGEELKRKFTDLQEYLDLTPAKLVEFLMHVFDDPTQPISRFAFDAYAKAKGGKVN